MESNLKEGRDRSSFAECLQPIERLTFPSPAIIRELLMCNSPVKKGTWLKRSLIAKGTEEKIALMCNARIKPNALALLSIATSE